MAFAINRNLLSAQNFRQIFLLTSLIGSSIKYSVNPDTNQWPSDYLTSKPYCKSAECELNACSAATSNSLPKFDYIIIGAGCAGSVLAFRLTKNFPDRKVLLIESGSEPLNSFESTSPRLWPINLNSNSIYNYFAEKSEKFGNAFVNGTDCVCGNGLGGSTGVNAMLYLCGTDKDYNDWAEMIKDDSWNYKNILPLIKKNQNMKDQSLTTGKCADFHGTDGPLVVTSSDYDLNEDNLLPILKSTTKEKKITELQEINCGPPYTGATFIQTTIENGKRETAGHAFLKPIKNNKNFYFMKESFVEKIHLKKESENVIIDGINVLTKQPSCKEIKIQAKREIILSAGAYGSPQILLRSGIGRKNDLESCNIQQFIDLPVGHNLSDHLAIFHFYLMPGKNQTQTTESAKKFFLNERRKFFKKNSGYFTTSGYNYHWFFNTKDEKSEYPDIQIEFGTFEQNTLKLRNALRQSLGFKDEFVDQLVAMNLDFSIIQITNVLLKPKSRGNVKLRDCKNPYAAPIINANYLDDENDYETVLKSIEILNNFMNSKTMKNAGVHQAKIKIKECDVYKLNSVEYNRCYIKYFSSNVWHPTGTCRMGFSSDDNVIDSKLKVFGVKKTEETPMLRITDASIMPTITSSNTQCPVYTIGEKAAAIIIEDNL